jgi:adenosylcobinamide kinase / adenosylcobinamide-phosphate guanylyltransferase
MVNLGRVLRKGSKRFFFEKKKQKTFVLHTGVCNRAGPGQFCRRRRPLPQGAKVFCFFFSKKKRLLPALATNPETFLPLTLTLGGARSGKSAYAQAQAEQLAAVTGGALVMIATGQAFDAEMAARIEEHRRARRKIWQTVEAPLDLAGALSALQPGEIAVVDCLTLWLSNLMLAEQNIEAAVTALLDLLTGIRAPLWLVSNEVGLGIVPENALARRFRDEAGRLHQRLASLADHVVLTVAGLPMVVKAPPR